MDIDFEDPLSKRFDQEAASKRSPAKLGGGQLELIWSKLAGIIEAEVAAVPLADRREIFVRLGSYLFAQLESANLPTEAPELYEDRPCRQETSADFARRVYAPWLGKGMSRRHIRNLDRPLYKSLSAWINRHPEDDFSDLPTIAANNDAIIEALKRFSTVETIQRMGFLTQNRNRRARQARP